MNVPGEILLHLPGGSDGVSENIRVSWTGSSAYATVNLIDLVDQNRSFLRSELLEFRRMIVAAMAPSNESGNLARTWMNPVVEMNPLKGPLVEDLLRLLMVRRLIRQFSPSRIEYSGIDPEVSRALGLLADESKIDFRSSIRGTTSGRLNTIWFRAKAVAFVLYFFASHWRLRDRSLSHFNPTVIVSYFAHLDQERLENGGFFSHQWSRVRDKVLVDDAVTWVHLQVKGAGRLRPSDMRRKMQRWSSPSDSHHCLESRISGAIFLQAIRIVLRGRESRTEAAALQEALVAQGFGSCWSLARDHWKDGAAGKAFARHVLTDLLFTDLMESVNGGARCLYLYENQGWERSLAARWHGSGRKELIGYLHTSVAFWGLPYFDEALASDDRFDYEAVAPDVALINGPLARNVLVDGGQKLERYREVEAFRYNYLQGLEKARPKDRSSPLRILVLGEYRSLPTAELLTAVLAVTQGCEVKPMLWFRPHPASPGRRQASADAMVDVSRIAIEELLTKCDIVVGVAGTTVMVEAEAAGVECVSFVPRGRLNMSSLLGVDGHSFARTQNDLSALIHRAASGRRDPEPSRFFALGDDLVRWREVLLAKNEPKSGVS